MKLKVINKEALDGLKTIIIDGYNIADLINHSTKEIDPEKLFHQWITEGKRKLNLIYKDQFAIYEFVKHEGLNLIGTRQGFENNPKVGNILDNIFIRIEILRKLRDEIIYTERDWYERPFGIILIAIFASVIADLIINYSAGVC